ncbi:MAG: heparinase II/III family protein, partial [Acidobacteriota bacterium]|nr:heparinase II/III family protein [Acidobacteriota bacterium]
LFLWGAMSVCAVFAQTSNNFLETDTMREDFQGDGLGQFASYPPAQDIGYEPSITPTSGFEAIGGRALMRVVQPTRNGDLRAGFIRKVAMVSGDEARLSFSYRLNLPNGNAAIELGFAGADGCRYVKEFAAQTNVWAKAETVLADFRCGNKTLNSGIGIEAFYIVANLKNVNKDVIYRFLIDDVSLSAERAAEFVISTPNAEKFAPWDSQISAKSYRANDRISIEVAAPTRLVQAVCVVKTSEGKIITTQKLYDDGTRGDKKAKDNIWTNNALYKIETKDAAGVWNAGLNGKTADGKSVSSGLRFIVYPPERAAHPHLYFDSGDKEKLLARMRDPRLAKVWEYIQTAAKNTRATGDLSHGGDVFELLDKEYLLPSLLGYFDILNRARSRIAYNAFLAYLTDDAEARTAAKEALLTVSRWRRWEPPWFTAHGQHTYYPAGLLAVDVALGYDLLYDHLSETERSLVRRAIIEKQIIPTYKEYFLDNRAMTNTSNWISHTVGGALIAASAIAGDVKPEESNGKFELYLNGLLLKIEAHIAASFLPDGSYGEGISYHEFDAETLAPMTVALRRAFGIDYFKRTHVKDSLAYALYTLTNPTSASLDMGDTHPPAGHGIPALVYQSKDPVLRWYYARFERPSLQHFIFYDDSVAPQTPLSAKLLTSRIFADKGNAAFRTGWGGADEIVLLFRAGANFNHHHADQGAFLLTAFGEPLITEAGWSDYYKDPYYATFFTQAVGHNTVLVDGNPESQTIPDTPQFKALGDYPRITDAVTSEFYDGVGSELSSVYQNRLARYVRRIVFVKPHYFVVFDDLKANGNPAQFDFLLHLPNRAGVKTKGTTAIYNGSKASLAVRSFAPDDAKLSVENGRIPYPVFSARTPATMPPQPVYLDFKTVKPLSETQFLTAIVPAKTETAAQNLINRMTEIAGENLKGIRVTRGNEIDLIMFRTGAGNRAIRQGDWAADAAVLAVTESANNLKMFAVQNARVLRRGSQILFSSEQPASVAVNFNAGEIEAVCNAETATKINLFVGENPVRVLLDGKELSANAFSFNRAAGTISLTVPAGQHQLLITKR